MTARVGVVTVAWNCREYILRLLRTLSESGHPVEVIALTDNASRDGTVEAVRQAYPQVRLTALSTNLGGAGGFVHALASVELDGLDYVWVLDGDAYVQSDTLTGLLDEAQRSGADILGSRMVWSTDHRRVHNAGGYCIWNEGRLAAYSESTDIADPCPAQDVEHVVACSMLVSVKLLRTAGFMDSAFFVFWDDIEFCARARALGFRVRTAPQSLAYHEYADKPVAAWRSYYVVRNTLHFLYDYAPGPRWFRLVWSHLARQHLQADRYDRRGHPLIRRAFREGLHDFSRQVWGPMPRPLPAYHIDAFLSDDVPVHPPERLAGMRILGLVPQKEHIDGALATIASLGERAPWYTFVVPAESAYLTRPSPNPHLRFIAQLAHDRYERRLAKQIGQQGERFDSILLIWDVDSRLHLLAPLMIYGKGDGFGMVPSSRLRPPGFWQLQRSKWSGAAFATWVMLKLLVLRRRTSPQARAAASLQELARLRSALGQQAQPVP